MLFYNFIFISLVIIYFSVRKTNKLSHQVYVVLLVFLYLFSAFRFDVGCDWTNYLHQFNQQIDAPLEYALLQRNSLWWVLKHGISELGLSYLWLNVVSSAIFFFGIHVLARRQPDPLYFLILLFPVLIINLPMSAIKQGAAMGLVCIAFTSFIDKKLFSFIAWTLIASLIHSSAGLFLLLSIFVSGSYSKKKLFLAGILALPGVYLFLTGTETGQKANELYIGSDSLVAFGAIFRIAPLVLTSLLFIFILKKGWQKDFPADFKLISIISIGMLLIGLLMPLSSVIADRLSYFLVPIQVLILARIAYIPISKNKLFYKYIPFIFYLTIFLIWTSFSHHFNICYIPYRTWIFGIPELF